MTQPDIFLSYNREDQATAKLYADAFAAEGLNVWWDTALRSGEAYDEVTEAALRGAKAVVVLWSPRSVVSRWVRAEATIADRCKTLVPVTIEPCERPIMFELTQTAELSHWTGDASDKAWLAFLGDVRRFVGREVSAPAPPAPITAPELARPKPGERGEAPSLAVLPFTNRSGLPEDDVFALGMVEDVIDALSQGVNVRVLSSSTTARFASGAMPDLTTLGTQLGVRYLLEGNVRRVGNDLRVTTQLVEAAHGEILSTQKFDRPLAELAALQEDLVRSVAISLGTQVYQLEIERVLRKPDDLTAWEYVTRSFAALRQLTTASIAKAREEVCCALEVAPDYGPAHALFAHVLGVIYWTAAQDNEAERQKIAAHVDRALLLDPNNAMVLTWAGSALTLIGRPQDGLRHTQKAVQRSPFYGHAHYTSAMAYEALGQVDAALTHCREAIRFETGGALEYAMWYRMGRVHLHGEDWTAADAAYVQSNALTDGSAFTPCEGALVARHFGRTDEAREMMAKSRQLDPAIGLADWERRLNLWLAGCPVLDELLMHLRALWAETEGSFDDGSY